MSTQLGRLNGLFKRWGKTNNYCTRSLINRVGAKVNYLLFLLLLSTDVGDMLMSS